MIWLPVVGHYADVDVYAAILAYADLLNQRDRPAKVYIPMAPNYSVPKELRLPELENPQFEFAPGDQAIILDVSNPEAIHRFVSNDQILELIDHHFGFEDYWQREIDERAIFESIGAVTTAIFERWGECWDYEKMSESIAKLLLAAILDNTLNFSAETTTERDRVAAEKLAKMIDARLTDFASWYFSAVSETILHSPEEAVFADNKLLGDLGAYQLTLWDAREILDGLDALRGKFDQISPEWFLNVISISEGRSYIFVSSETLAEKLGRMLEMGEAKNKMLIPKRMYLRKEILKKTALF